MVDESDFEACLAMLDQVRALPTDHPDRQRMERAVDGFVKDGKRRRTRERRRNAAAADRAAIAATSLGAADRIEDVSVTEDGIRNTLRTSRLCYSCKAPYFELDGFYHWLCPECAADNQARREARTDLAGRRALVTGGRVKIGFHVARMAKAALNMLTRTSAEDLAAQGVYMTSVDTGWITDENPMPVKESIADTGWRPPLDVLDGAARIYDPIVQGEAGDPPWGVLLKDYRVVAW